MSISKSLNILPHRCANVLATGLLDGEQFFVEYAITTGCNPAQADYAPYYENGVRVVLDTVHNPLTLWRPGWYRFVSDGDLNPLASVDTSESFDCEIGAALNNVAVVI